MSEFLRRETVLAKGCKIDGYVSAMISAYDVANLPAEKVVSEGLFDQIKWERDIALSQLEAYGIGLGEKTFAFKSPVKIGQEIYIISRNEVVPVKVTNVNFGGMGMEIKAQNTEHWGHGFLSLIEGSEWFETEDEAKAELERRDKLDKLFNRMALAEKALKRKDLDKISQEEWGKELTKVKALLEKAGANK